ncbi:SCO family protein [Hydrogenophaga aromaticivorans]|uniref:SCO family protein n=1 Tax=Hydrogenophaga aromaticivorans TaxID=2610898 RepID=UPI001B386FFA|nr:SCO family protein [Hydrogenophaga aromaticivorans]MBQ0921815.1 SCO family protein [Hydrogenophaga aromaticivorans]
MNSKRDFFRLAGGAALASLVTPAEARAPRRAPERPNSLADYFPNVVLETHDGRKVRFYDDLIKGKVVAINMMYSICTGICPTGTANLKQVQQALGQRLGKDVFMYSITLRPEFDNGAALRDYIKHYDIQPGWTFLTGKPQDVDLVRRKLGFVGDTEAIDADINQHTGMVRIGNERLERWTMAPALGSHRQILRTILELT